MIVISGALVLVALVLLVIGLVSTSLGFVYASIAVSIVSFVFLLIGILQRRGEQVPEPASDAAPAVPVTSGSVAAAGAGSDVEGVTTILPGTARATGAAPTEPLAAEPVESTAPADTAPADASVTGSVLVVPGRPRYHVSGCRYLTGKDPEEVDVQTARSDGYTACGVCKPDSALAEEAAAQPHPQPDEPVLADEPTAEAAPVAVAAAPDPVKAARRTTRATATTAPGKAPAKRAAATPAKAPAKAAAKKAPAKAAAESGTASKAATVVVIPDRGKFHQPDCRFVRDAADTKELSRTAASRQGYVACGVCKP